MSTGSGGLARRTGVVPVRREVRRMQQVSSQVDAELFAVKRELAAIADATQYGMFQAVMVKRMQRQLEALEPDVTELLAFMANNAGLAMAQRLQQFGSEV